MSYFFIFYFSFRLRSRNPPSVNICGFKNDDEVSCYANSVVQILFHCESLVRKIQNNELGTIMRQSLIEYKNKKITNTWLIRQYVDNNEFVFTLNEQQDCVQFLETLMNHTRHTFDPLFGFQEQYTSRCNMCDYTSHSDAPLSLIKHLNIPENRRQTLQQLLTIDQSSWSSIPDFRCTNCNNLGSVERKQDITMANEYLIMQLKLFTTTYFSERYTSSKITNLKLNDIPAADLVIAGSHYKPHAAIFHKGQSAYSGHYIAYLKQADSTWVCANDTKIRVQDWPSYGKNLYIIVLKRV